MLDITQGTSQFLVGTVALTIPSLLSTYYKKLQLPEPPVPKSVVRDYGFFCYQTQPQFKLLSAPHTIITHMFHHIDIAHWASNVYSIVTSAQTLDLGLWKTSLLFIGGGVSGALTHMAEWCLWRDTRGSTTPQRLLGAVNKAVDKVSQWTDGTKHLEPVIGLVSGLFPTSFALCGSSSGAFALIGAEFYMLGSAIHRLVTGKEKGTKAVREQRLADLLVVAATRSVMMAAQFYAAFNPDKSLVDPMWPLFNTPSNLHGGVAYSAHLGGFAFGVFGMAVIHHLRL